MQNISTKISLKNIFIVIGACIVLTASIMTLSRTVVVSSALALTITSIILTYRGIKARNRNFYTSRSALIITILGVMALVTIMTVPDYTAILVQRLVSSLQDNERLRLLHHAISMYTESIKTIIFGKGFMLMNPHNEYLRTLAESGIVGLASFFMLLTIIYYHILLNKWEIYMRDFGGISLFWFIAIAIIFYPLVKQLWVALMFLLIDIIEYRYNTGKAIYRRASKCVGENISFGSAI